MLITNMNINFENIVTELVRMAHKMAQKMLKLEITSNSFKTSTGTISDVLITKMNIHYAIIVIKAVQIDYKAVQISRN